MKKGVYQLSMDTLVSTLFFFIHTYKRACDFGVGMALSTAKTFRLLRSAHYAIVNYFCAIIPLRVCTRKLITQGVLNGNFVYQHSDCNRPLIQAQ